ncbi:MAG: GIY-YIG nuclease family protein [Elusimicrobiota bacterium]
MTARYRRMIKALSEQNTQSLESGDWSVYILRCADDTLYTGIAKDVQSRIKRHNSGRGAAYTRAHGPVELLCQEDGLTRSQALVREARIKKMSRAEKIAIAVSRAPMFSRKKPLLRHSGRP